MTPPEEFAGSDIITEMWFRVSGSDPPAAGRGLVAPRAASVCVRATSRGAPVGRHGPPQAGRHCRSPDQPVRRAQRTQRGRGQAGKQRRGPILEQAILEVWFLIEGQHETKRRSEGWAPSRYIQVYDDGVSGRIDEGDTGRLTTAYIETMLNDRFFRPALTTTFLLMVLIIPVQFVLAIIMALVIQAQLKGNTFFLYIFAIALAVSDLAVGIVWYSIFTQYGYLNSILQSAGPDRRAA